MTNPDSQDELLGPPPEPTRLDTWIATVAESVGAPERSYSSYLASDHWSTLKQRIPPAGCHACGRTDSLHLHHLTYQTVYRESDADVLWLCGEHHDRVHSDFYRQGGDVLADHRDPTLRRFTLNLIKGLRGREYDTSPYLSVGVELSSHIVLVGSSVKLVGLDADWYCIGRRDAPPGATILDVDSRLARSLLYRQMGDTVRVRINQDEVDVTIVDVRPPDANSRRRRPRRPIPG